MPRNVIAQTVKAQRRDLLRQLKRLDRILVLSGAQPVKRRRKATTKRKAKTGAAKVKAAAKLVAPAKKAAKKQAEAPAKETAIQRLARKKAQVKDSE